MIRSGALSRNMFLGNEVVLLSLGADVSQRTPPTTRKENVLSNFLLLEYPVGSNLAITGQGCG